MSYLDLSRIMRGDTNKIKPGKSQDEHGGKKNNTTIKSEITKQRLRLNFFFFFFCRLMTRRDNRSIKVVIKVE